MENKRLEIQIEKCVFVKSAILLILYFAPTGSNAQQRANVYQRMLN